MTPWALLTLLALALRLICLHQFRYVPTHDLLLGDAAAYDQWARQIAAGHWIGDQVFYQAPLYPYFLAVIYILFNPSLQAVRWVQALLGALACLLLGRATQRLIDRRTGLLACLLLAINPLAIYYDLLIQKPVLDSLLLAALLWALSHLLDPPIRRCWCLALGLLCGALALSRENALIFAAILPPWLLFHHRTESFVLRFKRIAMIGLGLLLALGPVALRNYAIGGELQLTTSQLGPNFYIGNNPQATGAYSPLRPDRSEASYERIDATELAEQAVGHALSPGEVSRYWLVQSWQYIRGQPQAWLRLVGLKTRLALSLSEMPDTEDFYTSADASRLLGILGWIGHAGVIFPLAAAGFALSWPLRRRLAPLILMWLAYAFTLIAFYIAGRYRLPLIVLAMPLAAAAFTGALAQCRQRRYFALAAALIAASLTAMVAARPAYDQKIARAVTCYNVAIMHERRNRPDLAIQYYLQTLQWNPAKTDAHNNLGLIYQQQGDDVRAADHYRKALALDPHFLHAWNNLGIVMFDLKQPQKAVEYYRQALALNPGMVAVHHNLGNALLALGKPAGAQAEFKRALALDPRQWKTAATLATLASQNNDPNTAMNYLQHALRQVAGDSPEATYLRNLMRKLQADRPQP